MIRVVRDVKRFMEDAELSKFALWRELKMKKDTVQFGVKLKSGEGYHHANGIVIENNSKEDISVEVEMKIRKRRYVFDMDKYMAWSLLVDTPTRLGVTHTSL